MKGFFKRGDRPRGRRIFFATDVHGSDACFRKFLNVAPLYDVSDLILGGDITGKLLIPILADGRGGYACSYGEHSYNDLDGSGLRELKRSIRAHGHYYVVGRRDELAALEDPEHRDAIFRRVVRESVAEWVALAEERLGGTGRCCYVAPGNDDFHDIDDALQGSNVVRFAENRRLRLDDTHEMITTGYSNPTPWETERELPEDELKARIDGMAREVEDTDNLVAVLHPPPHASQIDSAPALDEEFQMSAGVGGVATAPVGSTAVREFIEETQPLLGLHGHVHEGRGAVSIGRTLCLNPGSEYTEGVLSGALVELGDGTVLSHQFVSG